MSPRARSARRGTGDDRGQHGARRLPGLRLDHYNLMVRDPEGDGFLGDRASQTAFRELLDTARRDHATGKDPFGRKRSSGLGKRKIDLVLVGGDADAAHLVHLAVEEYARRLVHVVRVFLRQRQWKGVERILLGGGFPDDVAGGLAVRRAIRLLQLEGIEVKLDTLRHDADEGGRQLRSQCQQRRRHVGATRLRLPDRLHAAALEGIARGDQEEQQDADAVDVAGRCGRASPQRLGRAVDRRADRRGLIGSRLL